ncbi:uncharacterized protein Dere_GG26762, isoform B [Drosophila erecta]|uniref:Uncharacterized protein, isoform B n=1 Tax=Drosophila erecta TaxID=7220 RepID=A0A0Q5T4D6_DROER|nr:uncharacterized protein Dere_GG26762, isoform B [Drosophila erecta]
MHTHISVSTHYIADIAMNRVRKETRVHLKRIPIQLTENLGKLKSKQVKSGPGSQSDANAIPANESLQRSAACTCSADAPALSCYTVTVIVTVTVIAISLTLSHPEMPAAATAAASAASAAATTSASRTTTNN